jgi:AsmA protein
LSFDVQSTTPPLKAHIALATTLNTDLNAQRYTLQPFTLSVRADGAALPVHPLQTDLQAEVAFDQAQDVLAINNLSLQTLNLDIKGTFDVQALSSAPAYRGRISMAPFSPRELMKSLQVPAPETADPAVLNKAAVEAVLAGTTDQVELSDLQITLDDTRLNGKLGVRQFAQPAITFDLKLDAINADRYLPPDSEAPPSTPETAAAGAAQLPLEMLRGLDIDGLLAIGKLIVSNLTSEQISLGLRAKGGELRLTPIKATLYGGQFDGTARLDVRGDTPKLAVRESLSGIQAGPLLKDLIGDDKLSGTGSVTADLTATGVEPEALMASLNGTANFLFRDGAVKGINIAQLIRSGYAKLKQQAAPAEETRQTDFAELSGSLNIRNGVVSNNDLAVKSPLLRISGKGSANLPKQTVDYVVNTSIVGTLQGQAGASLDELKSVTIPVHITGSLLDPKFSLDVADALSGKAKAAVEQKKQQLQEQVDQKVEQQKEKLEEKKKELKDKAKDKLQDKLKKLM